MSELQVGDLAWAIKGCSCGRGAVDIGRVFTVAAFSKRGVFCPNCWTHWTELAVLEDVNHLSARPISFIRKIEPLPKEEEQQTEKELTC